MLQQFISFIFVITFNRHEKSRHNLDEKPQWQQHLSPWTLIAPVVQNSKCSRFEVDTSCLDSSALRFFGYSKPPAGVLRLPTVYNTCQADIQHVNADRAVEFSYVWMHLFINSSIQMTIRHHSFIYQMNTENSHSNKSVFNGCEKDGLLNNCARMTS